MDTSFIQGIVSSIHASALVSEAKQIFALFKYTANEIPAVVSSLQYERELETNCVSTFRVNHSGFILLAVGTIV